MSHSGKIRPAWNTSSDRFAATFSLGEGLSPHAFPLGGRWVSKANPDEGTLFDGPFGEDTSCVEHLFRLSSFGTFPPQGKAYLLMPSPWGEGG